MTSQVRPQVRPKCVPGTVRAGASQPSPYYVGTGRTRGASPGASRTHRGGLGALIPGWGTSFSHGIIQYGDTLSAVLPDG